MPRATLPSQFKNIRSMEVLLTQTTEEEIWEVLKSKYDNFMKKKDTYVTNASNTYHTLIDGNPYANKSKISERPLYENPCTWITEENTVEYFGFFELDYDLQLYKRLGEAKDNLLDMLWELERFRLIMTGFQNDIKTLEENYFRIENEKHKQRKRELLEKERAENPHKFHKSIQYWEELFASDSFAKVWHDGQNLVDYEVSKACEKCIERHNEEVQSPVQEIIEIKKQIVELKEHIKFVSQTYECKDCKYTTSSKELWTYHITSTDHKRILKLKDWVCDTCKVQSRTQIEWDNHIQTKKHLNKCEVTDFVCEKCDYKTKLKHHWTQHCETKKHQELNS